MDKTLMNCGYLGNDTIRVYDYTSIDLNEIKNYLNSLDNSWFEFIKLHDDSKIEKVCYDYYDTADYYDLILFINGRDMLYDMSYNNDVVMENSETIVKEYEFKIYGNDTESIFEKTREKILSDIINERNEMNLNLLYLKVIKKEHIHDVKRKIDSILSTQKEMVKLLDYLND